MTLKVAIVGCGKISDGHVGEVQKLPHLAQVVAVCDTEILMAEQLANRFGVQGVYADYATMLERERPDVVHIATPPRPHLSLAKQALDAGCHIYVEKPLAPTHAETVELIEYTQNAGKLMTAGYNYYFDPPARRLREMVAAGELGELVHIESVYGYDLAGPFGSAVLADGDHWVHGLPGALLQNNIDHMLYKIAEYFDDEPDLAAFGNILRPQRFGDARDQMADELRLMLRGERITGCAVFSSFSRPMMNALRVCGTKNTATVDFSARTIVLEGTTPLPSALGRLVPAFERSGRMAKEALNNVLSFGKSEFHLFDGLKYLMGSFYESIESGGEPPIPYRSILWTSSVMNRIWEQLSPPSSGGVGVVS